MSKPLQKVKKWVKHVQMKKNRLGLSVPVQALASSGIRTLDAGRLPLPKAPPELTPESVPFPAKLKVLEVVSLETRTGIQWSRRPVWVMACTRKLAEMPALRG